VPDGTLDETLASRGDGIEVNLGCFVEELHVVAFL
jgi:hypothetical protein